MSRTRLIWDGDFRFTAVDSWGNAVALDGQEAGGRGARPSDLLPISLAACTAYDVVSILRKQRQELLGLEATVESQQDPDPPWRYRRIAVAYVAHGRVDQRKAQRALDLAESKYCSVSATLRETVDLAFSIMVAEGEGSARA